jgi:hypothetical protein
MKLSSPAESLADSEVANPWVVRSRHDLGARRTHGPSGIPSSIHAQGRDSLDNPLLGFDPPLRYFPKLTAFGLATERQLSWGFLPLQRIQASRVHVPPVTRWSPRMFPFGRLSTSPTSLITVPLAGFLNLSAACSSHCPPAIFRQVALLGFRPSGGYAFHEAPTTHRRRHALLTLLPRVALPPS